MQNTNTNTCVQKSDACPPVGTLTKYRSEETLTRIRSSPTRTFSPSDRCLEAGWMVHQQASPGDGEEGVSICSWDNTGEKKEGLGCWPYSCCKGRLESMGWSRRAGCVRMCGEELQQPNIWYWSHMSAMFLTDWDWRGRKVLLCFQTNMFKLFLLSGKHAPASTHLESASGQTPS